MNKNFKPTNQRKNLRLPDFDYSQDGLYFVTIVTQNRVCLFGAVDNKKMILNDVGKMIEQVCQEMPQFMSKVSLEYYVIMPNHFHGIIVINQNLGVDLPKPLNQISVQPGHQQNEQRIPDGITSLSSVVQRFKSLTTYRYINGVNKSGWPRFNGRLWQRNYYEHIIRNERDYQGIVDYIILNPQNWESDEEYRS